MIIVIIIVVVVNDVVFIIAFITVTVIPFSLNKIPVWCT